MTPLSLVGMSMSARKRAARLSMFARPGDPRLPPRQRRFILAGPWGAYFAANEREAEEYPLRRAIYRIGERLRPCVVGDYRWPCPGCEKCDGSGVLPAKRSVKQ